MNLAIVSYKGGVGKTTVASNLASHLALLGAEVHAIDMDDQNALRLHFGVNPHEMDGIGCHASTNEWNDVGITDDSGVFVYPHGSMKFPERVSFKQALRDQPTLLKDWLRNSFNEDALVVIDTPPGGDVYSTQAIVAADCLLVVLNADGASFATIGTMEGLIEELNPDLLKNKKVLFLVVNYNEMRELDRSVLLVIRDTYGDKVAPAVIHYDASVREAFVHQKLLKDYDSDSQAHAEFSELARWLVSSGFLSSDEARQRDETHP